MKTKTLSERIEELNKIKKSYEFEPTNNEFFKAMKVIEELEEELQERKAYIVANPCAQCGGRINAMKCDAWAKKANELEEKLKNNDMSKLEPKIDMKEECVEPVSIWKDVSELLEYQNYHVIGKMKDGKCIFGFPYQLKDGVSTIRNIDNIGGNDKIYFKCFSTLTDFVNQVEDMEARLRKLEGK